MNDELESKADEAKPPKIKAEDNPWYLLATLYGVPGKLDDKLREKNRIAWNRYFAAYLDEETRVRLINEKRHNAEELAPYSPQEFQEVAIAIAERYKASAQEPAHLADAIINDVIINFSNVEFEQDASFKQFLFSRHTNFREAAFRCGADFDGATFSKGANFAGAIFFGDANLGRTRVDGWIHFNGGKFCHSANFSHSNLDLASFHDAKFFMGAYFVNATFAQWGHFQRVAFSKSVMFTGATFSGEASFDEAKFCGPVDFGGWNVNEKSKSAYFGGPASFVNAEMKGETSFEGATFDKEPPRFFGAKLHQGTVWRGVKWPPGPRDKNEAGHFIDAYACLKLEMDRLKKHEDELNFFALELQSRRVLLGYWKGLPIALYGLLSDYGRSYFRPLVALFVVAVTGAGAFWTFDGRSFLEALGLSAENTLSVFGFRKDFDLAIDTPLAWLKILAALQTLLGTILLFLFGLGVRNKFRMK
jgi:uncharacterized protein YjbI with pentapeptide repeats